jgi:SAM-dependent methyltransferase
MQAHSEPAVCPVCGRSNRERSSHSYSVPPWILKQCAACLMVYLENPPVSAMLEDDLAWEKTFETESTVRQARNPLLYRLGRMPKAAAQAIFKRDKLLSLVKRYIAPGPILDVGCAGGHTLAALPAEYIPCGVEISRELARVAGERFGPRGGFVKQGDAPAAMRQLSQNYFTGVLMTSYLEHETKAHAVLEAARGVMKDSAKLIIKVPNYASWNRSLRGRQWCGFRFPDHVNYFTPQTLTRLLVDAGFAVHRFGLVDRLPTSDTMWLIAKPLGAAATEAE